MTNIFISGYYGLDNIGDEAILSGMINCLNFYIDNPNYFVLTNNSGTTKSVHNVIPIEQSLKKGNLTFLKNIIIKSDSM